MTRPTLVFIHGSNGASSEFERLIEGVSGLIACEIKAPMLLGHGGRPVPDEYEFGHVVEDLLAWLDDEQVQSGYLIGHSFGGYLGLYLAKHHPERVRGLICIATPYRFDKASIARILYLADPDRLPPGQFRANQQIARHGAENWRRITLNNRALFERFGERGPPLAQAEIRGIEVPSLVLSGESDQLVPIAETRELADLLGGSLLTWPSYGHPLKKVPLIGAKHAIARFVDQVERGSTPQRSREKYMPGVVQGGLGSSGTASILRRRRGKGGFIVSKPYSLSPPRLLPTGGIAAPQRTKIQFECLKQPAVSGTGPVCVAMVRNENYLLPHFLAHYRRLGVSRFVFYDDKSNDGTREFLLAQEDCTVLASQHNFQDRIDGRPFHHHVKNLIPEYYGEGGWSLLVDADEFLLLPAPFTSIPQMIEELDARGAVCALAPMVDFYPARLREREYDPGLGPFEGCAWWFDRDPGFSRDPNTGKIKRLRSGVRARLLDMLLSRFPEECESALPVRLYPEGFRDHALLWKVPLVKTGMGIVRLDSHSVNVPTPADVQLALAHFKFHPALDKLVEEALELNNHFMESREYRFLDAAVRLLSDQNLLCERSVRYESPGSLEEAGLLFCR